MAQFDSRYSQPTTVGRADVDAGLRAYMLGVYNYMAAGVALTGIVSYLIYSMAVTTDAGSAAATLANGKMLTSFGVAIFASPLKWVLFLAPIAFVFFFAFKANSMSVGAAQTSFWVYAALVGASLSSILLVFTGASVANVFFITAATFASLSVWGYTTKKDISAWGSFLFMGLIGVIIASLVNIFMQSSAIQFAISVIGVLVFAGLTAYDTQRIKDTYYEVAGNAEAAAKASDLRRTVALPGFRGSVRQPAVADGRPRVSSETPKKEKGLRHPAGPFFSCPKRSASRFSAPVDLAPRELHALAGGQHPGQLVATLQHRSTPQHDAVGTLPPRQARALLDAE